MDCRHHQCARGSASGRVRESARGASVGPLTALSGSLLRTSPASGLRRKWTFHTDRTRDRFCAAADLADTSPKGLWRWEPPRTRGQPNVPPMVIGEVRLTEVAAVIFSAPLAHGVVVAMFC